MNGSIIERTERLAAELQCYPREENSAWRWLNYWQVERMQLPAHCRFLILLPNINIVINFLQAVSSFNQF